MNELKIINKIDEITEEIDFINEEILKDLKIDSKEFNGKDIKLFKIKDNIFQIKFIWFFNIFQYN